MSAEAIAKVVADLRAGRYRHYLTDVVTPAYERYLADEDRPEGMFDGQNGAETNRGVQAMAEGRVRLPQPVVDMTAVYTDLAESEREVNIYGDHPSIASPWPDALLCYVNGHGNVVALQTSVHDYCPEREWSADSQGGIWAIEGSLTHEDDEYVKKARTSDDPIPWDRCRWIIESFVWVGGSTDGRPMQTVGPVHALQFAVAGDGEPLDIHWLTLDARYSPSNWDMATVTILGALNFLNCSNVEAVEPRRSRGERRRIERTGITVTALTVYPTRARAGQAVSRASGVPLTSVRGHFAEYGPRYGKGLLFGKYEGRFWVPMHARGSADEGISLHDRVVLKP
jgi:hypothetical protein